MGSTALSPAARRWRRSWTWCSDWRTATAASLYSTRPATGKELIGHERGAFTGAFTRKTGLFEAAQGGTVFLDEIAILSVDFQGKLLRVIQERQLRRVGGTEILDIDMRLLSATNEDLDKAMVEGRFRQDLFYRLNVLTITLAALRERDGHVPLLAEHFVKELNQRASRKVDGIFPEAMQVLRRYEWPGNVRELQNAIEGAFSLTESGPITLASLPFAIAAQAESGTTLNDDGDTTPGGCTESIRARLSVRSIVVDTGQCLAYSSPCRIAPDFLSAPS